MLLLENPRKRRRSKRRASSPRRRKASRRRRNPVGTLAAAANPRRRRRSSRRRATSRRRRRNPFAKIGGGGAIGRGLGIVAAEVVGDLVTRVAWRFGLSRIVPAAVGKDRGLAFARIGLGLAAPFINKFLPLPLGLKRDMAAVNIASGVIALTMAMRSRVLTQTGLAGVGDYVTAEGLSGDYGVLGQDDEETFMLGQDSGVLGDYVTAEGLSGHDGDYEGSAYAG